MSKIFDVMVIGLGAHGSSAVYHLSKTGCSVLGIDQFKPPHIHGSSHGQSRIIRQAYHENSLYVPFVKEAYRLWHEIEKISGKKLLLTTGGLMLGSEISSVVRGAALSARTYKIPFESLDCRSIKNRFPALNPPAGTVAILEKDAGILFPELCIETYLEEAKKCGVSLQFNERVISIIPGTGSIEIVTEKDKYRSAKIIISAGAWLNELLPGLRLPLTIERQVLYWFKDKNQGQQQYFKPSNLPVYIWEYLPGKIFYGFPDLGDGIKIAFNHGGLALKPGMLSPPVSPQEINSITETVEAYLNLVPKFNYATTCRYTNTPDENFIIDFHPQNKNILIASPCSGHGFKFASVTGKILSDMIAGKPLSLDIFPFRISRFIQDAKIA